MRRLGLVVLSLGVLAVSTSTASAQGFGRGFGGGGGAMLLSNKGVQQELKLNAEQQKKVDALASVLREKMTGLREKIQDIPQEDRTPAKMAEIMKPINDELKKSLGEIVTPAQLTRFNQISLQARNLQAFTDPEIVGKLKLTDDQKSKIQDIAQGAQDQRREIFQSLQDDREAGMKKLSELNKNLMGKATALLSADQKAAWKDMTGEPYEVKFEPPPGR